MDNLVVDQAQLEFIQKVKDILRQLYKDDWQAETHFQHQKIANIAIGISRPR